MQEHGLRSHVASAGASLQDGAVVDVAEPGGVVVVVVAVAVAIEFGVLILASCDG